LIIITLKTRAKRFYDNFIQRIFGSDLNYAIYSLEDGVPESESVPVILPTHDIAKTYAHTHFPKSQVIDTKMVISGKNIETILSIPAGERVLIVHDPEILIDEVIDNLKQFGITHLNFVPYRKQSPESVADIQIAISAGMLHHCPAGIRQKIDIGGRIPTIETFMALLEVLHLDTRYLNNFLDHYIQEIMQVSRKLVEKNQLTSHLLRETETIINNIDEGIVVAEKGCVTAINPIAQKCCQPRRKS
jgi:hypothetical protein